MAPDYYETAGHATAWYILSARLMVGKDEATTDRGHPLVATRARWLVSSGIVAAAFTAAVEAFLLVRHTDRTLASFAWGLLVAGVVETCLVFALLRAEESHLARELRTARAGSAVLRGLCAERRNQGPFLPFLARLFSTRLGVAAVLLADGDRSAARDALEGGSVLMRGGRLDALRAVVNADLERASGTPDGRERCIDALRGMAPLGHREADLYRIHVLVKALLELGDSENAVDVLEALEDSPDEETQIYVAWLRVWFDMDAEAADDRHAWPVLPEGQLRMATLLARAQGAEKLVEKLEERVSSIAHPQHQE